MSFVQDTIGGDIDLVPNLGLAALYIGDDTVALNAYGRFIAQARDAGAPVAIQYGLARRAAAEIATGDWPTQPPARPRRGTSRAPPVRTRWDLFPWRGSPFSQFCVETKTNSRGTSPSSSSCPNHRRCHLGKARPPLETVSVVVPSCAS